MERAIFELLLSEAFMARDEIHEQLRNCLVRVIDEEGSLEIQASGPEARVERRVPVEAAFTDSDGIVCHILLHVVDGVAAELELYKDDGSPVINELDPAAIRLHDFYGTSVEIKRTD